MHGDFGSNNVLADGTVTTGVIDWGEAMFGDPRYDIANIFLASLAGAHEGAGQPFRAKTALDGGQCQRSYLLPSADRLATGL